MSDTERIISDQERISVDILSKILVQTKAGKIKWRELNDSTYRADITEELYAQFELQSQTAVTAIWAKLFVMSEGKLLVRAQNLALESQGIQTALSQNLPAQTIFRLASELFEAAVMKPKNEKIDGIMRTLDSL
jgi:hypothetical protein